METDFFKKQCRIIGVSYLLFVLYVITICQEMSLYYKNPNPKLQTKITKIGIHKRNLLLWLWICLGLRYSDLVLQGLFCFCFKAQYSDQSKYHHKTHQHQHIRHDGIEIAAENQQFIKSRRCPGMWSNFRDCLHPLRSDI